MSKDTLLGLWLVDELEEDDEILVDELLALLDALLLEELLEELLLVELDELLELLALEDELLELLLDVELSFMLDDVLVLDDGTLLDELPPLIFERSQALTHIAISINALIKMLFFFI